MKKQEVCISVSEKVNKALDVYVALERVKNPKLKKKQAVEHIITENAQIKSIISKHKIR